ncbi:3-oxoacyl-ACP reductase family protein [Euryhalocaulis caribicus]|uniref:3-oxoacyl-ACP reductase family protein n=1 Tax=Euryhalocaulis caribicus TaxID=1161401 RepID=UPI0003A5B24F|nr:3-oxoacyl-ACP reductase family protein [Euryhalocaulis caribicus]
MALPLEGKSALVTGGSRGIGAAIAHRLAEDGADVAITYARSDAAAEKVADAIRALGRKALPIKADSSDPDAVQAAVRQAAQELGGLDILVNNAGIFEMGVISDLGVEDFDRMVDVNVRAVFAAVQEASGLISDKGRIITIGSVNADTTPLAGMSLYGMSKAAVQALTRGWARDFGPRGVTVNVIQPGPIDTDMNPAEGEFAGPMKQLTALGRYGETKDIADLTAFVAGPDAGYITGAAIDIDGGFRL